MRKNKLFNTIFLLLSLIVINHSFFELYADARPGGGSSFRSSRSRSSYSSSSSRRSSSSSSSWGSSSYKSKSYSSGSYGSKSYSSGSTLPYAASSSSADSDIDFDDFIGFLIFVGVVIFIIYVIVQGAKGAFGLAKQTFVATGMQELETSNIDKIKSEDPNFSRIVFIDFVNSLYTKYYHSFGDKKLTDNLKPYISSFGITNAMSRQEKVHSVVIGSINIIASSINDRKTSITVEIDSNYSVKSGNKDLSYFALEKWTFVRNKGVISKEPEAMQKLACPNCGGPNGFNDAGACEFCGTFIQKGEMQWFVEGLVTVDEGQLDNSIGGYVEEMGTKASTIHQKNMTAFVDQFKTKHLITTWDDYLKSFKETIVKQFFTEIYKSWSENKINKVRPFISERIYESFSFWIDNYESLGRTNKLDDINISNIELAKVELDKFYEAFTVRISASCFDYTVDRSNKVIGGSKSKKRNFSEYWTFVRRTGVEFKNDEFNMKNCPSCGAPISESAKSVECEYCGSTINSGEFSWVLAQITQDEVYSG